MWPTYAGFKIGNMPIINLHRIIGVVFIVLLASNTLLSRAWLIRSIDRLRLLKEPLLIITFFYFWRLLSIFSSPNIPYSFFLIMIDILLQFVIFISIIVSFEDSYDVKIGLKAILFGAVLVVLLGLIEFISEQNLFVKLVPNSSKNIEFIASAIEEKIRDNYRVQAAFMHPLVLAEYLIIVIPISASFIFDKEFVTRFSSLFVFFGGILVLYSTGSRSGIVVLGVQLIFFLLLTSYQNAKTYRGFNSFLRTFVGSVSLIILVAAGCYYGRDLIIGKGSAETMSTVARIVQLINGISAVSNKPLLGHGPGFAPEYAGVENIASGRLTLDNYYLTVVIESGLPALLLLILCFVLFYRYSRLCLHTESILFNTHIINLISCSVVGFIVFCIILSTYEVFGIAFAIFGMILVLYRNNIILFRPTELHTNFN